MAAIQQVRTVDPIELDNFVLDGEAVRDPNGKYLAKSQQGWEKYFASLGERLPTLPEYVTIIAGLERTNPATLGGIMQDLQESALCTGTKIDYSKSNIPVGNGYLDVLVKYSSTWKIALQDLLQYDVKEAASVLRRTSGKLPYISTPNAEGRKLYPERVVWLSVGTDRFNLYCDNYPINSYLGRARGVREVGARAEKTGSAYRNQVLAEEKRLERKILGALSPFDQLKTPVNIELYDKLKNQALQELKKLYHG